MVRRQVIAADESVTDRANMVLPAIGHFKRSVITPLAFSRHEVVNDSPVWIVAGVLRLVLDVFGTWEHSISNAACVRAVACHENSNAGRAPIALSCQTSHQILRSGSHPTHTAARLLCHAANSSKLDRSYVLQVFISYCVFTDIRLAYYLFGLLAPTRFKGHAHLYRFL